MQDTDIVPSRCVWFHNVPAAMCDFDIKSNLEAIYQGPIRNVFLINHPNQRRNPKKPPPRTKLAIVEFKLASTATAVLGELKKWSNGSRIIARQTNKKSKSAYSELSRLRLNLNDDCLHTLCKYLSFWDVFNLAQSSVLLLDFLVDNYLPSYVRNCDAFSTSFRIKRIGLPLFKRALKFIGPQLTRLTLSGDKFLTGGIHMYMEALSTLCPALVSLCLSEFRMHNRFRVHGVRFEKLKELQFLRCKYVGAGWIDLIGQLDGLESLSLNDCLDPNYSESNIKLRCSNLRKLTVFSNHGNRHCQLLMDAVRQNGATLRELYMRLDVNRFKLSPSECNSFESCFKATYYGKIAQHLPQLECLWVRSLYNENHSTELMTMVAADLANLANMQHLRKLVVDGNEAIDAWMPELAQNPENSVEHLVLLHPTAELCQSASSFGARIRVLELWAKINEPSHVAFGDHFTGLHTLVIRNISCTDDILVAAIESCPALDRVVVEHHPKKKVSIGRIVDALRRKEAAATVKRRTPFAMVVYDSFDSLTSWKRHNAYDWRKSNARLIAAANSNILRVWCKTIEFEEFRFDSTNTIDGHMQIELDSIPGNGLTY